MRIDQIIPSMRYAEEIYSTVLFIQNVLKDFGCSSDILTEPLQGAQGDYIIYHMLSGSCAARTLAGLKAKGKVLFYHGIMPPGFLKDQPLQLDKIKNQFDFALTTTSYLEQELRNAGFGRTRVLPLPVNLEEYDQKPDLQLMEKYGDDHVNILFAGPVTAAQKLEDTISIFNYYHKKINPRSRLFLVGSCSVDPWYCQSLLSLIKELEIKNVFLTGRVSFRQLLAYYRLSRIFLCMSEYEGFSVPLLGAMYLKVPIVALNRAAVAEILGGSGCLVDDNGVRETARLLDRILKDRAGQEEIVRRQSERVAAFLLEVVHPLYRRTVREVFGIASAEMFEVERGGTGEA